MVEHHAEQATDHHQRAETRAEGGAHGQGTQQQGAGGDGRHGDPRGAGKGEFTHGGLPRSRRGQG